MTFAHLWVLHLLWLLPITIFALIVRNRQKKKGMESFADSGLMDRLMVKERRGVIFIKDLSLLIALVFMLVALAGPRWGSHYQDVSRKGVDIMLAMDVSKSMLAEDVKPDRLERARREIVDLLRVVQGDRVGLVIFAGVAYVYCPLTLDYGALKMFLDDVRPGLIPVPGTDIGGAIDTAVASFDEKSNADRVIILVTDGEDNEGKGVAAARRAAAKGVKIFVFGIGDVSGGPIPAPGGKGGFLKDKDGNLVLSKLDERGLKEIAAITGGTYVRSVTGDLDLDILYFEGIKSKTNPVTLKSGKIMVREERFTFFVLAAFFFLLLEGALYGFSRRVSSTHMASFILAAFMLLNFAHTAMSAEDPDKLYREGRFSEAEKGYLKKDMDNPKAVKYRYNRGCAAYRASNLDSAEAAFSSVLVRTKDKEMRFKAAYNLGNTAFKKGNFASAVSFFRQAIIYNPKSADARYNLELALRKLKRQEKEHKEKKEKKKQQGKNRRKGKGKKGNSSRKEHPDSGKKENKRPDAGDKGQKNRDQKADNNKADKGNKGKPDQRQKEADRGTVPQGQGYRNDHPEKEAKKPREASMAAIDRKKAEALLDNIKEDRSRFMRLYIPGGKGSMPRSGKDW